MAEKIKISKCNSLYCGFISKAQYLVFPLMALQIALKNWIHSQYGSILDQGRMLMRGKSGQFN